MKRDKFKVPKWIKVPRKLKKKYKKQCADHSVNHTDLICLIKQRWVVDTGIVGYIKGYNKIKVTDTLNYWLNCLTYRLR